MTSDRMTLLRSGATVAVIAAAAIGLTGCGIGFTPASNSEPTKQQTEKSDAAPSNDAVDDDDAADSPDSPDSADSADSAESSDDSADSVARDKLEAAVERTVTCDGGTVDIAETGAVLELDADCSNVTLSGSGTSILADDIASLKVTGTGITVFVDDLGALDVTGIGNTVTWESGTPKVSDTGTGNVLKPAS